VIEPPNKLGCDQWHAGQSLTGVSGWEMINEGGKASLTPLCRFVTKLEGGKGGGSTKFLCHHDYHQGKPYTYSYTRVRKNICGVMESDDNKGGMGISIFPKISEEERYKYVKIEKATQRNHRKKQKLQFDASSRFCGNTSPSPHGSRTFESEEQ
jgi:hypothetical protein